MRTLVSPLRALPLARGLALASVLWMLVPSRPALAEEHTPHYFRPDLPQPWPSRAPERIVSLAPVVTEALFALGAGPRVVGVTRYCDRPAAAAALPKVGGYVDPQLEAILALRPDLVIAMPSQGQRALLEQLRRFGVPVLVVFAERVSEVDAALTAIAEAVDRAAAGAALRARLAQDLAAIAARAKGPGGGPRTVIAVSVDPLVLAGPHTFADEAIPLAGGRPAVPRNAPPWPGWSIEALIFLRPDVVVAAEGPGASARLQAQLAALGSRAPRVTHASGAILMRPGPYLAEDVATLADLLHPGAAQAAAETAAEPATAAGREAAAP